MTPEQFCYWLQGRAELKPEDIPTPEEWQSIREHLATVFKKVTPAIGPIVPGPDRFAWPRPEPQKPRIAPGDCTSTSRAMRASGSRMSEATPRLRGRAGVEQRKRRLARTNGLCEMCPPIPVSIATVVDHVVPLALGGSDEDSNTRNLCHACHTKVTAEQFGHKPKVQIGLDGWPCD